MGDRCWVLMSTTKGYKIWVLMYSHKLAIH